MTRITGRAAFLQLLVDEGVTHLFGNPGTTELHNRYRFDPRGVTPEERALLRTGSRDFAEVSGIPAATEAT